MTEQDLIREFGKNGWKQLPDVVTKRYKFVPAKIEVEEHHIGVYVSKKDGHMKKRSIQTLCFMEALYLRHWQLRS